MDGKNGENISPFFSYNFSIPFFLLSFFQLYLSHWNSRELIFKDMCIHIYIGGEKFSSHQTNSILL